MILVGRKNKALWLTIFMFVVAVIMALTLLFPVMLEASPEKEAAIAEAEAAIDDIPDPVSMEDMMSIRIARHLVDEALELGAVEGDIDNYDDLDSAEEAIEALYYDNYMRVSLFQLPNIHAVHDFEGTGFGFRFGRFNDYNWWREDRTINGMSFLPKGAWSASNTNTHEVRWVDFDVSGFEFSYIKGYAGIDDGSTRSTFPITFEIYGDGDLLYSEVLEHGEYAKFYLLDIEGVDTLRLSYYAEVADGDSQYANQPVLVLPDLLLPITAGIEQAIADAEEAIEALPEVVSLLDEDDVKAARALVDEAFAMGVEREGRIDNLDILEAAEASIESYYQELYLRQSLIGRPVTSSSGTYGDPDAWSVSNRTANYATFEPLRSYHTAYSSLDTSPRYAVFDLSGGDYYFLQGYLGICDDSTHYSYSLNFKIQGDGATLYETVIHYGRDAIFYRIDVTGVDSLRVEWSVDETNPSGWANHPYYVEPVLLHSPQKASAIYVAEQAIAELPDEADITLEDKGDVEEARLLVDNAIALGAEASDISNLDILEAAEAVIAGLLALPTLIADAIAAIDALPDPEDITNDDRPAANAARSLVDEALVLGAEEADITNLAHLEAVEAVLADLWDVVYGDVNDDGVINVEDVVLTMQHILGLAQLDENQQEAADVNGDGQINVEDVILIMQRVLGLIEQFPVEN